jgi:hypothetical protein
LFEIFENVFVRNKIFRVKYLPWPRLFKSFYANITLSLGEVLQLETFCQTKEQFWRKKNKITNEQKMSPKFCLKRFERKS